MRKVSILINWDAEIYVNKSGENNAMPERNIYERH